MATRPLFSISAPWASCASIWLLSLVTRLLKLLKLLRAFFKLSSMARKSFSMSIKSSSLLTRSSQLLVGTCFGRGLGGMLTMFIPEPVRVHELVDVLPDGFGEPRLPRAKHLQQPLDACPFAFLEICDV